jgi:hypothetical protein
VFRDCVVPVRVCNLVGREAVPVHLGHLLDGEPSLLVSQPLGYVGMRLAGLGAAAVQPHLDPAVLVHVIVASRREGSARRRGRRQS